MQNVKKLLFLVAFIAPITLFAQKWATLRTSESKVTITGTSTLHDWEENLSKFDGSLELEATASEIKKIGNGQFKCSAKSIESESSLMSSKTYEALKADKHPEIIFILKDFKQLTSREGNYNCILVGDVNIAGITRTISVPISGTLQNNVLTISGASKIKLSDFEMTPPTALMGSIKVGNEVSVNFTLKFSL